MFKIPQVTYSVAHTSHNLVLVIASDLVMCLLISLVMQSNDKAVNTVTAQPGKQGATLSSHQAAFAQAF